MRMFSSKIFEFRCKSQRSLAELSPASFSVEAGFDGLDARMVLRHRELGKLGIDELSITDLCILIAQQSALENLIPIVLPILERQPFSDDRCSSGDLLDNVLAVPTSFWKSHADLNNRFVNILHGVEAIRQHLEDYNGFGEFKPECFNPKVTLAYLEDRIVPRQQKIGPLDIAKLGIEDLYVIIRRQSALELLIPIALPVLERQPFTEAKYFAGDLLNEVLAVPASFWESHPSLKSQLDAILLIVEGLRKRLERMEPLDDRLRYM